MENAPSAACPNLMDFGGVGGGGGFKCGVDFFSYLVSIAALHYSQPKDEYGFIVC